MVLSTKNINKYFYEPDKFQVLKDINLEIPEGQLMAIVGKSGCGKSTLLYTLSTLDTDYEGELFFKGESLTKMSQKELAHFRNAHIGFVFQFHYLLPYFSVLENVMLPAKKLGRYSESEIKRKAMEKLELLDISDQALKSANKLSGGQQQRVAIARALINDPEIIMGDEPTGNLDSKNAAIVFDTFKKLAHDLNQTILFVTHDDGLAQKSDEIIEMSDGMIVSTPSRHP